MNLNKQTVITIIYTPSDDLRCIAGRCLRATTREFPNDRKILAVDVGSPELEAYCAQHGWTIVYPGPGQPPRMGYLLRECMEHVTTDAVWIIEHDAQVLTGRRDAVSRLLAEHDDIAGVDCMTVSPQGKPTYPCCYRINNPLCPDDDRLIICRNQTSLNCGCWRREAWDCIDWDTVPVFPATDRVISQQMMRAGWKLAIAREEPCVHYVGRARKHLPKRYWRG